jgi:hypothetical protein
MSDSSDNHTDLIRPTESRIIAVPICLLLELLSRYCLPGYDNHTVLALVLSLFHSYTRLCPNVSRNILFEVPFGQMSFILGLSLGVSLVGVWHEYGVSYVASKF